MDGAGTTRERVAKQLRSDQIVGHEIILYLRPRHVFRFGHLTQAYHPCILLQFHGSLQLVLKLAMFTVYTSSDASLSRGVERHWQPCRLISEAGTQLSKAGPYPFHLTRCSRMWFLTRESSILSTMDSVLLVILTGMSSTA